MIKIIGGKYKALNDIGYSKDDLGAIKIPEINPRLKPIAKPITKLLLF